MDARKRLTGQTTPNSENLDDDYRTIFSHWPATTTDDRLQIIVEVPSGKLCVHWMILISEISLTVPRLYPPPYPNPRSSLRREVLDGIVSKRRRLDDSEVVKALLKWNEELQKELNFKSSECFIRHFVTVQDI